MTHLRAGYDALLLDVKKVLPDLPVLPTDATEAETWNAMHYVAVEMMIKSTEWMDIKHQIPTFSLKECRTLAKVILNKDALTAIDAKMRDRKTNTDFLRKVRCTLDSAITDWCETIQSVMGGLMSHPAAPDVVEPISEQEARWLSAEAMMTSI